MTQYNPAQPLTLSKAAEKALLDLTLKYELTTGIRVNWRKKPAEVLEMVKNALNSDVSTLAVKAWAFVEEAPSELKHHLPKERLIKEGPADRSMTYRGASMGSKTAVTRPDLNKKQTSTSDTSQPQKRRMYRGVAID